MVKRNSRYIPTYRIYELDVQNVSSRAFLCRYVVRVAILQAHHVGCHISRISKVRVTSQLQQYRNKPILSLLHRLEPTTSRNFYNIKSVNWLLYTIMAGITSSWRLGLLVVAAGIFQLETFFPSVEGFATLPSHSVVVLQTQSSMPNVVSSSDSETALFATKKKKKKGGNNKKGGGPSFGGFGGGAMESCPCGSGDTYSACCSQIHKNVQNFRKASAQQIVQARYSAYAKKNPEFLMMSTHPNNKAFNPDLRAWKESIK